MNIVKGRKYRFKHSCDDHAEPIEYIGKNWSGNGYWHQFTKNGKVWSELTDNDLHLLEPVTQTNGELNERKSYK
jgi:hypothetical protein